MRRFLLKTNRSPPSEPEFLTPMQRVARAWGVKITSIVKNKDGIFSGGRRLGSHIEGAMSSAMYDLRSCISEMGERAGSSGDTGFDEELARAIKVFSERANLSPNKCEDEVRRLFYLGLERARKTKKRNPQ